MKKIWYLSLLIIFICLCLKQTIYVLSFSGVLFILYSYKVYIENFLD
jgi:hypothetical protein